MIEPLPNGKLAIDGERRALQHNALKSDVEADVNAEIAAQAGQVAPASHAKKVEQVAGTFRKHAIDEVVRSEREVQRSRGVARVSQVIDYLFFLVYALLGIRFVLALIAAKSNAGFVKFMVSITSPLYAPFKGIVDSPKTDDGNVLLWPVVVAIGVYIVLHVAINRMLRLVTVRKTEI